MFSYRLSRAIEANTKILEQIFSQISIIKLQNQKIMTQQASLADQLNALGVQVGGLATPIQAMEAALANQSNVEPELQAAFDGLKTQVGNIVNLVNPPAAAPPADGGSTATPPADGGTPPADGSTPPADGSATGTGDGSTPPVQS